MLDLRKTVEKFFQIPAKALEKTIVITRNEEKKIISKKPFKIAEEYFFAIGIIGTGLFAVPVLAGSTAYTISESFGWKQGLHKKLKQAYAFYGVIIVSMLIGLVANFAHLDPIKGLIYAAVANGLVAPIVLYFIVKISSNARIMSNEKNNSFMTACGWFITAVMAISGIAAIASVFF